MSAGSLTIGINCRTKGNNKENQNKVLPSFGPTAMLLKDLQTWIQKCLLYEKSASIFFLVTEVGKAKTFSDTTRRLRSVVARTSGLSNDTPREMNIMARIIQLELLGARNPEIFSSKGGEL